METRDMNLELYVAPEVVLLEVQVEKGFAGSLEEGEGNVGAGGLEEGDI